MAGNLSKAISLLDNSEKKIFQILWRAVSFNPHNMFICRTKEHLKLYYDSLSLGLKDVKVSLDLN